MMDSSFPHLENIEMQCAVSRGRAGVILVSIPIACSRVTWRLDAPIFRRWARGQAHQSRAAFAEADVDLLINRLAARAPAVDAA